MRAFLGIDLPGSWRTALAECSRLTREALPAWTDARWVPAENLHVTLVFLGEVSESAANLVLEGVRRVAGETSAFDLDLAHAVTGGPGRSRPWMLWSVFDDLSGACGSLVRDVRLVVTDIGIPIESRPFRPHVTLTRTRRHRPLGPLPDYTNILEEHVPGSRENHVMSVQEIMLFSSMLSPSGASYERRAVIPLRTR